MIGKSAVAIASYEHPFKGLKKLHHQFRDVMREHNSLGEKARKISTTPLKPRINAKTGVSVTPQKGFMSSNFFNPSGSY